MFAPSPTGLPALAALMLGVFLFVASLLAVRVRRPRDAVEQAAQRSGRSRVGIAVQIVAFASVTGNTRVTLDPLSSVALLQAMIVFGLWAGATVLFLCATRAMGRNWSIVARTRADHELVQSGPFAHIRHPIYTAIACQLVGLALALGHWRSLVAAVPIYALGTWLRISEEERMLRTMFGDAYDAYARRVKRFAPGLF